MSILHPLVTSRNTVRLPGSTARDEAIDGLRALADFLEAHPEVPLRRFERPRLMHTVQRSNARDSIAEVMDLAKVLGVEAKWTGDSLSAVAQFGSAELTIFYSGEPDANTDVSS